MPEVRPSFGLKIKGNLNFRRFDFTAMGYFPIFRPQ